MMRKILMVFIAVVILCTSMFGITAFAAEQTTDVNFRLVLGNTMQYASCSVKLERYATATSQEPLEDDSFNGYFSIKRTNSWEHTMKLEPGFYEIAFVSVVGGWDSDIFGKTERFEVKGDQMTVYVAVENEKEKVPMPPNWLVYGEDTQDFYIWADEIQNPTEPTDPSTPDEPTEPTEPGTAPSLPGDVDIGVEEGSSPERPTSSGGSTIAPTNPTEPEQQLSAKIGDVVFYVIIFGILITCIILLKRLQKQRGA